MDDVLFGNVMGLPVQRGDLDTVGLVVIDDQRQPGSGDAGCGKRQRGDRQQGDKEYQEWGTQADLDQARAAPC